MLHIIAVSFSLLSFIFVFLLFVLLNRLSGLIK